MVKMEKDFIISRVVTRDVVRDFFAGIRNFFGFRLRTYEKMIDFHTEKILEEMRLKYKKIKWYRININQLTSGSAMINVYGVYEDG